MPALHCVLQAAFGNNTPYAAFLFLSAAQADKADVDFVAVDMPNATKLTVGIMALVAQQEREATSARTRAALAAAKARGTRLGGYRGILPPDAAKASAGRVTKADLFAFRVGPLVRELRGSGMAMEAIARELAAQGIRTARGGIWTGQAVKNLLARGSS